MGVKTTLKKNINPLRLAVGIGLTVVSVGIVSFAVGTLLWQTRTRKVKLAAGSKGGESFIIAEAFAKVVKQHHPKIEVEVVETGGTSESLKLLQQRKVTFAAAQADIPTGDRARLVAQLYPDTVQLVVPQNSKIKSFSDLKGKRIAINPKGGQFRTFIEIATHFGYNQGDFIFLGTSQQEANEAYRKNRADATFFVRALGHEPVEEFIRTQNSKLIPIGQAKALQSKYPAFQPSEIPQGAYRGNPPTPAADLPTISIQRTLVADQGADFQVVETITRVLNERRQEIAKVIPDEHANVRSLVTNIDRPSVTGGTGVPIHAGANAYYDRDKPSFIQENADYVALIITIVLLFGSWAVEAKNWIERRRKDTADIYIDVAVELMQDEITATASENRDELDKVFVKAARDLVDEKISQDSFRTFNEAYKTAREVLERKINETKQQQQMQNDLHLKEIDTLRKENADNYITQVLSVAQQKTIVSQKALDRLDKIMQSAGQDLIDENISQESFRTFIEAYKTVRDTIVRQSGAN